jgi:hypothetical protein
MSKNFDQIVIATDTFAQWLSLTNQMANAYKNVVTTATNTAGDTTAGNGFVSGIFGANTLVVNYEMRGGDVDTAANLAIVSNVTISGANSTFTSNVFVNSANLTVNANTFSILGVGGGNAVTITTNSSITNSVFISNDLTLRGNTTVVNATSFSNAVSIIGAVRMMNTHSFVTASDVTIATSGANTVTAPNSSAIIVDSFSGTSFRGGKYIISIKDNSNSTFQMTELLLMHDAVTGYTTEYATLRSVANNLALFSANLSGSTVRLWATPSVANSTYQVRKDLLVV